jgi:predicted outer membrane protein
MKSRTDALAATILTALTALLLSCAHTGALVEDEPADHDDPAVPATETTETAPAFAIRAALINVNAIELGRLAQSRAFDGQVRGYALAEIGDHVRMNEELHHLAKERGWDLPRVADPDHRALEDEIQHTSGPDVDAVYVRAAIADHVEAVSFFQRYVRTGDDADLVAWTRRNLPVLEKHQDRAEQASAWVQPSVIR